MLPDSSIDAATRYTPCRGVLILALVGILSLFSFPCHAKKTDVVRLSNGNEIIGEIKTLDTSLLTFDVEHISNKLKIKWDHVVRLKSKKMLDIDTLRGSYYGSLIEPKSDGELRIKTADSEVDIKISDVVFIEPIKDTFIDRLEASLSTGISFTKATDILQFNFGGSVEYRKLESYTVLRLNTIITSRSGERTKTNSDLELNYNHLLVNRWFYRGDIGFTRNDELGIDLRSSLAAGIGKILLHTNRRTFNVAMLLSGNRENTSDGRKTNNIELVIDAKFHGFRHDTPKLDFKIDFAHYTNLNVSERYRVSWDARLSLELFKDLFWDISQIYYRYDSQPSTTAASTSDYGIISGVRYKL
jgi:hypothetical protein